MKLTSLGELASRGVLVIGDGYRTRRDQLGHDGFRILRVADVVDGTVSLDGSDHVLRQHEKKIGQKAAEAGDVILTTKGTVGRVAVMPPSTQSVVYSPQLCFFRVLDREILDPNFLKFWFRSEPFLHQSSHRANNTDMAAYINLADIRSLQMELPDIARQRASSEVLGALDDKIAANTAVVLACDDLASTHYAAATAHDALSTPLSGLAEFVNGRAFTKNPTGTGRVVVRIAELNSGVGASTVRNDLEVPDRHLARPGDLLFAWSGSLTVHRWFRPEAIVNQHIFKVVPRGIPLWLVHGALRVKLAQFRSIAADKATTMGHIQRHHLDEPVPVPSARRTSEMDPLMTSLWDRALTAERESERLAATRDALLPLLMSGSVTVKDAEAVL